MAMDIMRAALMIDLGGNGSAGLARMNTYLEKTGLITEKNRPGWRGMTSDIKNATAALGAFYTAGRMIERIEPGAARLQTSLRNLKINLSTEPLDDLDKTIKKYSQNAFMIQAKFAVDMTDVMEAQKYLKGQQWGTSDILGVGGHAATASKMATIFKRDYANAEMAAVDVSQAMRMFGLTGSSARFGDILTRASTMGVNPADLMHQMEYVGPLAKSAFGARTQEQRWKALEETVFGISLGVSSGAKPEAIGRYMGDFLARMAGGAGRGHHGTGGLNLWETTGTGKDRTRHLKDWIQISDELNKKFGNMTDARKREAELVKIFGEQAARLAVVLMDLGDRAKTAREKYQKAPGAEERIAGLKGSSEYETAIAKSTLKSISDLAGQRLAEHKGRAYGLLNSVLGVGGDVAANENVQGGLAYGLEGGKFVAGGLAAFLAARGLVRGAGALKQAGGLSKILGLGSSAVTGDLAGTAMQQIDKNLRKVFVVNWPNGGWGGGAIGGAGLGRLSAADEAILFGKKAEATAAGEAAKGLTTFGANLTNTSTALGAFASVAGSAGLVLAAIAAIKAGDEAKAAYDDLDYLNRLPHPGVGAIAKTRDASIEREIKKRGLKGKAAENYRRQRMGKPLLSGPNDPLAHGSIAHNMFFPPSEDWTDFTGQSHSDTEYMSLPAGKKQYSRPAGPYDQGSEEAPMPWEITVNVKVDDDRTKTQVDGGSRKPRNVKLRTQGAE